MTPAKIKILMTIATFKHPEFPHVDINPTVREIANLAGSSSTTVHEHIKALVGMRYLKKANQVNSKRVYVLTDKAKGILFDTVLHERDKSIDAVNKYGTHKNHCGDSKGRCDCGLDEAIKGFI